MLKTTNNLVFPKYFWRFKKKAQMEVRNASITNRTQQYFLMLLCLFVKDSWTVPNYLLHLFEGEKKW